MIDCLAIILAGGQGSRLSPLTLNRAKPAVPFGGLYRIIDFTMSNCVNSQLKQVLILTQYKSLSLSKHVDKAWRRYFCIDLGEFVEVVPPQQRLNKNWYLSTADAVYQNIYSLEKARPKYTVILAGDHIYKMDYRKLVEFHKRSNAELTIAAQPVHREDAHQFGVMEIQEKNRIVGFAEKPENPRTMPGAPSLSLASMGIYVFNTQFLLELLRKDASNPHSSHDFGRDLIPSIIDSKRVFAFPFEDENRKATPYWRDVGTIESYYQANMDLVAIDPLLNLYDERWPVRCHLPNQPPPKFVFSDMGESSRRGKALDSIVGLGTIISGGLVRHSVLGNRVRINSFAKVEDSILFNGVTVERGAQVRRAIIEKHVCIPARARIGFDLEQDRARGVHVTENGIAIVTRSCNLKQLVYEPHYTQFNQSNSKPSIVIL